MKDLEFRAWDTQNFKYINIIGFYRFDGNIILWFLDDKGMPDYKSYRNYTIIIEQYTGKKDKNNVKIFENDIVRNTIYKQIFDDRTGKYEYHTKTIHITHTVNWNSHWCHFEFTLGGEIGELEIIGHIHDNS